MNTFLNQPPTGSVAVGQVWDCTLVMMEPKPWLIIMVPSVAMKGGSFSLATITPLRKPNTAPTSTATSRETISGKCSCLKVYAPSRAAHIITVPRDRSMPPVMMIKVTPKAMKPM